MIISAANIETNARLQADLVIIGAGAAGITIAKRFAGKTRHVIVLESGGTAPEESIQALYKGVSVGQFARALDITRLRYLGGTTNHWGGWCRPLEPTDFMSRSDWPESGWPISRSDLDPYYRDAAEVCQLGPVSFDDLTFWQRQPGGQSFMPLAFDETLFQTAIFQVGPPTRFGPVYEPMLRAEKNIDAILDATVLELLPSATSRPDQPRKSIGSVRVTTKGSKTFTVSARAFVVAAGGMETARLLLLSDKVHPTGAGNENDLVGRYFMDHLWMREAAYLRFAKEGVQAPLYFQENPMAGARMFGAIAATPELIRREGTTAFRFVLFPSRTSTAGIDSARTIASDLSHGTLPDHLSEHLSNILSDFPIIADSAYKTITGSRNGWIPDDGTGPYIGANVDLNFEQRPNRDSRVSLDSSLDANGQRRVRLDWRLGETERRTATRALDILAHEFGRMGLGRTRMRLDVANGAPWPREMIGSDHHSGTARMSESPKLGVVDAQCRVHSCENLYIASSAVFPTGGYANPTFTIVALALRLADHLEQVLA